MHHKLSILLITYNQEKYIHECIESILMQNVHYNFDIVVADDHSDDKTLYIIENEFTKARCKFRILTTEKNIGYNKNYQRGLGSCSGEYIAVMEGDDYWTDPDRLQKHVFFLEKHRECVMSFNRIIEYVEEDARFDVSDWRSYSDYEYITTSRLARGNCIGNFSACVFRNSSLKKMNSEIYEILFSDWILGLELSKFGLIAYLKDPMSVYRIHGSGQWSKMSLSEKNNCILQQIDVYNNHLKFKYNNEFTYFKNWIISTSKKKIISKGAIIEFIPPIVLSIIDWILPAKFIHFIKKLI